MLTLTMDLYVDVIALTLDPCGVVLALTVPDDTMLPHELTGVVTVAELMEGEVLALAGAVLTLAVALLSPHKLPYKTSIKLFDIYK